jgi:predicted negative regulator of RcsB-dependent stress response
MKRKVKKQLKSDEFASLLSRVYNYVRNRQRELMIAGTGVFCVALVIFGIKYIQNTQAKKQSEILGQILQLETELKTNPEKLADLERLEGNGKFSRMAYLKVAAYAVENGNLAKAMETLEKFPNRPKDIIYYQAQDMKAQIYMQQKKYDEALKIYNAIEDESPQDYALDIILFQKARALAAMNNLDQAISLFKRIQEEFPGSYYGFEASQEAQKLEEKK